MRINSLPVFCINLHICINSEIAALCDELFSVWLQTGPLSLDGWPEQCVIRRIFAQPASESASSKVLGPRPPPTEIRVVRRRTISNTGHRRDDDQPRRSAQGPSPLHGRGFSRLGQALGRKCLSAMSTSCYLICRKLVWGRVPLY